MKCQKCGKDNATVQVKRIVNGEYTEYMLCPECASKMGYKSLFSDVGSEFSSLLGSFFGNTLPARSQATHCPSCGSTYYDIADSGKVGCAHCYETFIDLMLPSIRRIHGNTTHCGKKAVAGVEYTESNKKEDKLSTLKKQLEEAVEQQNFEEAVKLRDEIRLLEGNNG